MHHTKPERTPSRPNPRLPAQNRVIALVTVPGSVYDMLHTAGMIYDGLPAWEDTTHKEDA